MALERKQKVGTCLWASARFIGDLGTSSCTRSVPHNRFDSQLNSYIASVRVHTIMGFERTRGRTRLVGMSVA